jgi:hypothetical protein
MKNILSLRVWKTFIVSSKARKKLFDPEEKSMIFKMIAPLT